MVLIFSGDILTGWVTQGSSSNLPIPTIKRKSVVKKPRLKGKCLPPVSAAKVQLGAGMYFHT